MMDLFEHRYYKINKMFLHFLGLWPHQTRVDSYARATFFLLLVTSQVIPQIVAVVKFWHDPDIVIQSIPPFVTDLAFLTKASNIIFNFDKMFEVLERMRNDWISLVKQPEIDILHDYAQVGRQCTLVYTAGMYMCLVLFIGQPTAPKILEALKIVNGSKPGEFPFPVDYFGIDMESYYYYIIMHSVICVTVIITTLIAADTMFMVQVQHACGMFTVVGHQLRRMADKTEKNNSFHGELNNDAAFRYVVICIKQHKQAIELGDLIEASYTWSFFSIVGFNMIVMSVTGYQTVAKMDENPQEAIRYAAFTMAQILHLFFQSFFSQRLKDHSEQIREYVYQAKWHGTSLCVQKLLSLVIMRTNVPCQLTAGKILPMSLENFAAILKTSMSYFTLMRSMQ